MEQRPFLHLGVVAIEKGAFRSPSTKVANNYLYTVILIVQFNNHLFVELNYFKNSK